MNLRNTVLLKARYRAISSSLMVYADALDTTVNDGGYQINSDDLLSLLVAAQNEIQYGNQFLEEEIKAQEETENERH